MKNPDNGKIKFKIMVDSTVVNIVDEAGNKLTTTFESQILEHHDDSVIDVVSFTYDKVDDSHGILTLTSNQEIISVDGSNKVNGLKLKYKTNEYVIANGDFILQDNKKEIKATVRPFILFNETTVNTVDFIAEFIPTADIIGNRNKDLSLLNQSKTFTHSDVSAPSIVDITFNQNTNILSINLSETIVDLGEVDYGNIKLKKEDGTLENLGNLVTSTNKLKVSSNRKSLEIDLTNLREVNFANEPLTKIIKFGIIFDANVNNIKDFVGNLCSTTDSVFGENFELKQPKDVFIYSRNSVNVNDPESLDVWFTFDYTTSISGSITTTDNQPDKGFYVVSNNKRYPLENCITLNESSQLSIQFKPFELLHDVMPDEHGEIKFEVGYDPTIGNLISRFGHSFDAFETTSGMGFGHGDTIEMIDWRLESLVNIPDPDGKKDHISTDKLTLIFNKNIDKVENSHLIGHDILVSTKLIDHNTNSNFNPLTIELSTGINLNEEIKNVEVNGSEISFNIDLAQFGGNTQHINSPDGISQYSEKPIQLRYLKYIKNKTIIKDNHRNEVKNFDNVDLSDTSKFITIQRPSDGDLIKCTYNQIDDNTGEFILEFNDYITSFDYTKLKLDMNNTGYSSGIEFMEDVFVPDFNSKTQRVFIKTKEVFDKNGIDTTDLKEFKLCFPIELVEFGYTYRLPSPNTPDRNYYCDMKHDFIETTRPFKLIDFEIKTVDNVPNDKETTLWVEEITLTLSKDIGSIENLNKITHNLSMYYSYARTYYNSNNYDQFVNKEFYSEYDNNTLYETVENISYSGNKIMLKLDLARILFEYKKNNRNWNGAAHADTPKSPYGILGLVLETFTGGAIIKDKHGNEIVSNKSDYGFNMFNYPNDVPKYTLGGRTPVNLVSHRYNRIDRRKAELTLVFDVPVDNLNISDMVNINLDKNISYDNGTDFGYSFSKTGEYEITITERDVVNKYKRLAGTEPTDIKTFSLSIQPIYFVFNYMSHPPILSDANNGVYTFEVTHDFSY